MGSKMQYETKFPMTNQVMLQNLTMTLLVSLAGASNQASSNNQDQANNEPAQRVYRWRKRYGGLWSFVSWRILWTTFSGQNKEKLAGGFFFYYFEKTIAQRSLQSAEDLGDAMNPPAGLGQSPGGVWGEALENILDFYCISSWKCAK